MKITVGPLQERGVNNSPHFAVNISFTVIVEAFTPSGSLLESVKFTSSNSDVSMWANRPLSRSRISAGRQSDGFP